MEKSRVTIREGSIAYVRQGKGDPVVLIHGMPTSAYLWRDVIPPLAQDFTVFALDLLGYGDSDKPKADLSLPAQARYVAEFMLKVGLTRATVAGHDIGGGVAQLLGVERPGRDLHRSRVHGRGRGARRRPDLEPSDGDCAGG